MIDPDLLARIDAAADAVKQATPLTWREDVDRLASLLDPGTVKALVRAARRAVELPEERAWLIALTAGSAWWCGSSCFGPWSTPDFAVRFARRKDAEAAIRALGLAGCRAEEHAWIPSADEQKEPADG